MKITISLISTIILSILLLASLYYGFLIKPKEITYTSYIPTTYKETKTSYITERETLTKTETYSTTLIKTTTLAFKPLGPNSIIMLIGDLHDDGPNSAVELALRHRIDVAASSGVDTVIIVFRTTSIEQTYDHLDQLIRYCMSKGLSVIPRIVVDSKHFSERLVGDPNLPDYNLPDYTNSTQLRMGMDLLSKVLMHLEEFPNIVGYQVEWGHYGESWINSVFWNSHSANESFRRYILRVAPQLAQFDFAWWWHNKLVEGDIVYYSSHLPASDPRSEPAKVALFYWYQEWRNHVTLNITWSFRRLAKMLTSKPIIGFSYVGAIMPSYVYSADRCIDIAYSPFTPHPHWRPTKFYQRDAFFDGLQLVELDFDSPYIMMEYVDQVIRDAYEKKIIPVIFYPLWSKNLRDSDIPKLVELMKKYSLFYFKHEERPMLIVVGYYDIGYINYSSSIPIAVANWHSVEPPGLIKLLEDSHIKFDMIDARVYRPEIGERYRAVIVFVPRNSVEGVFMRKLEETNTKVFIVFPSFIISSPSMVRPYEINSAIMGMWNKVTIWGRNIGIQVTGSPPSYIISFRGVLSFLGRLTGYTANYLMAYYSGDFDEVLAEIGSNNSRFPLIARIRNIYLVGLDIQIPDENARQKVFEALKVLLET
jgi:hypothetical protein